MQTNVFESKACGWTNKKYSCMHDGEALSKSLGRLEFEPASGTVSLAAIQSRGHSRKLGVCGWQERSGVYCCANTRAVNDKSSSQNSGEEEEIKHHSFGSAGDRVIAECPGLLPDSRFRPAQLAVDE